MRDGDADRRENGFAAARPLRPGTSPVARPLVCDYRRESAAGAALPDRAPLRRVCIRRRDVRNRAGAVPMIGTGGFWVRDIPHPVRSEPDARLWIAESGDLRHEPVALRNWVRRYRTGPIRRRPG
ncbi:hypothetical protein Ssi03_49600 [Sphaerisporangium siamense]|nr:hypothetical protein Ssi03_49600 [Sphaerisporangium siamense]